MISEVSIKNFKSLRDVRVKLERFTVFVGANASGKSSILQALDGVCGNARLRNFQEFDLLYRSFDGPLGLAVRSADWWYRHAFVPNNAFGEGGGAILLVSDDPESAEWKPWRMMSNTDRTLIQSVLLRLEATKLIPPTTNQATPTGMAPDGTGLHAALTSMALNDPDSWQELQADLRRIIPTIRRLRHSKVVPGQTPPVLFDTTAVNGLHTQMVSEGTLLVLGLLTALYAPDRPNLILLDDLDRGLHPKAQRELVTLLRGLLKTNPELQIVATTHSPYLLDCMEPSEVRMTCLRDDGSTVCDSIENHPEFPKWKDDMYPGELWSLFGERWLLKEEATV